LGKWSSSEGELRIDDHSKKRIYNFQACALNHSAISPPVIFNRTNEVQEQGDSPIRREPAEFNFQGSTFQRVSFSKHQKGTINFD